jgi:hypothetical protein
MPAASCRLHCKPFSRRIFCAFSGVMDDMVAGKLISEHSFPATQPLTDLVAAIPCLLVSTNANNTDALRHAHFLEDDIELHTHRLTKTIA